MKNTLLSWLPFAMAITVLSGMVYGAVQQNYRQTANDPQIQIGEDLAVALSNGQQNFTLPTSKIDIAKSLAPFVIILDDTGKELYSSASLDGASVVPPAGVMAYTKANGQDRITWQPKNGVRLATIVANWSNEKQKRSGFVIVGRSLREIEVRIRMFTMELAAGWFTAMISTLIVCWFMRKKVV